MSAPSGFAASDHRWETAPGLEAWVREVLAPGARRVEDLPGAEVVKRNRMRTVVRVPSPDGALYVKRFRVVKAGERLLSAVRASKARREHAAFGRLRAAGVRCPEPVVLGEERGALFLAGSVLATREAAGCRELPRELDRLRAEGAPGAGARRELVERLAGTSRAIFASGVDHPDLHLANFLVDPADGGLVVLDLHSVALRRRPPGRGRQVRRLAKLVHSLGVADPDARAAAEEELAWLAAAWVGLDPGAGPPERLAARLGRGADRLEAVRLRSRDRRCLVTSTDYVRGGVRGRRMYRRREVPAQAVWAVLDADPAATVHAHPKGRSRIEVIGAPEAPDLPPGAFGAADRLLRKLYLFPRLRARLEALWDPLPLRAWRAARACEVRRVPHPRHHALVCEGVLPRRATIVMDLIEGATMVHVWLEADPPPAPRARRALAAALGRLVGRFHRAGLRHRDLALQNLLIRPRGDGTGPDGWEAWVVDLDEVRVGPMSRREKVRALVQLADLPPAATRTDRLRFFRAYLAAGGWEVFAPELARWGERGLGARVAAGLRDKARRKATRAARRGHRRPQPTDVSALGPG